MRGADGRAFADDRAPRDGRRAGSEVGREALTALAEKETLEASLRSLEARYDALFNAGHVVVLLVDPANGRIVDANSAAVRFYGWSRERLLTLSVSDISTAPASAIEAALPEMRQGRLEEVSTHHRLASGEIRDVDVICGPVLVDGRQLLYSVIRDTSAKRREEEREERLQRLLAAMAEIDHVVARLDDAAALFSEGCRVSVEVAGFGMAWFGRVDEASPVGAVEVLAHAGGPAAALENMRPAACADVPEGQGVVGRALREATPCVVNDILSDETVPLWRDRAARHGHRSIAALPLVVPGHPRHVFVVYSPQPAAFGRAELGLLERIVDDIAFRLRVIDGEAALRASEERYRSLVEQAPDGILVVDRDGRFLDASDRACEILGLTLRELRGISVHQLARPEQRAEHAAAFAAIGDTHQFHVSYVRPDGRRVEVELHGRRLADGRLQAVLRDVTATRAVEEERDRLATAVEQAAEAVTIVDASERIAYVNPAFSALTGYPRDVVVGQPITIVEPTLATPALFGEIAAALLRGDSWSGRVSYRHRDGRDVEMDVVTSPIRDRDGVVVGSVTVGRDTTEQRALEAQLAEAQRLEVVGRLAGGVAHDFNNLLTAISGYGELALSELDDPEATRADVEEILKAAGSASILTRQLLAFSRRQVLQPRVIELTSVVEEIAPMLRRLVGESIRLEVRCGPRTGRVVADPTQLGQVLMNLVVNARDAMPRGGLLRIETAAVDVSAEDLAPHLAGEPCPRPGRFARLSVSDTGAGIPPDVLEHVFEPFFTTKERGKGTGLGLAMVFGVVRQSYGFVTVDSQVGHGSTFSVHLPRAEEPAAAAADPPAAGTAGGGRETILVVEDEPQVGTFARRILERRGFRVLQAGGGEEALEIAERAGYAIDLLFTDVVMPSVGGHELAERLLAIKPDLPVLFASGYSNGALGGGQDGREVAHLDKPYTSDELVERVREVLAASKASRD